jgi:putative membrane protein
MQQIYTDLRGVCAAMNDESQPDTRIPLAIERTDMAIFRTSLALDRTTLAWIRTTLTMATFGLGMIGFFRTLRQQAETPETIRLHQSAVHFGVALVVLGIISTFLVAISHISRVRKLKRGEIPSPPLWPLSVTISVLLSLMALFELWNLFRH